MNFEGLFKQPNKSTLNILESIVDELKMLL